MGFVFIACRPGNRTRAQALAAKLTANQIEVCAGLEEAQAPVRDEAYRAVIDRGALMVALWSQDDHADAIFVDHMLYAQRSGRLFAIAIDAAPLPATLGADTGRFLRVADMNITGQDALLEMIVQRLGALGNEAYDPPSPGAIAAETAAFLRVQRRASAGALASFLRRYPDGVFEPVARDLLDAETRPQYPDTSIGPKWLRAITKRFRFAPSPVSREEEAAKQVWRMDASLGSAARDAGANLARRARTPVGMAIAGVILLVALGGVGMKALQWSTRPPPRALEMAPNSAVASEVRPNRAPATSNLSAAAPADPGPAPLGYNDELRPTEVVEDVSRAEAAGEMAPPAEALTIEPQPTFAAAPAPTPTRQTENRSESDLSAIQLARRQNTLASYNAYLAAFPGGGFVAEAQRARDRLLQEPAGFDLTQLDGDARALVQRARETESTANREAARSRAAIVIARPGAPGEGDYNGAQSGGVANGLGRVVWSNGDIYAGAWAGSLANGFGVLRLANGARYEGQFAGGVPTGRGVFWNEEGRRLTGDRLFAALVRARSP